MGTIDEVPKKVWTPSKQHKNMYIYENIEVFWWSSNVTTKLTSLFKYRYVKSQSPQDPPHGCHNPILPLESGWIPNLRQAW